MTLRLHDTATRDVRDFVPLEEGKAGIYVCGLTVQSEPHVGHVRSAVNFDVLRRWLTASGYDVTFIRNVTDIDDKILAKAETQGRPWFEIASTMERELHRALDAINVLPPTYEPAATGHVPEILELIGQLIAGGHAYPAEDGSGDVYFDVRSWPSYGELTRQRIDDMEAAEDADPRGKRDPRDFALWKGWKKALEPETAAWPSPYGPGRPGWHIECSAMAWKHLGETFDIHGGGIDLVFPHHENEIAQSRCAFHLPAMANFWMHNGFLQVEGAKMAKSEGNFVTIRELLADWPGEVLRLNMLRTHYRQPIDWTMAGILESQKVLDHWYDIVSDMPMPIGIDADEEVVGSLCDDLNTPSALTRLHALAGEIRTSASGLRQLELRNKLKVSGTFLGVLTFTRGEALENHPHRRVVDADKVNALIDARNAARKAKNFKEADRIRDELKAMNVELEDHKDGSTTWKVKP